MPVSGQPNLPITYSDRDLDAKLPGLTSSSSAVRHWIRVTMKEYAAWHGRITSLVFFFIILFTGIILGVFTTLSVVGFYGNPESGFLSTSFASFSSSSFLASNGSSSPHILHDNHLDADSDANPPNNEVNESFEDSDNFTNSDNSSSSTWTDPLYEERREVYHGNTSEFLGDHPVDLSLLSDAFHHMSDEELLQQASSIVATTTSTEDMDQPPKVAFLFLTRGPLPFTPLWERYFRGYGGLYSIYIHAHPRFRPNFSSASVFYRRNVPSKVYFALNFLQVCTKYFFLSLGFFFFFSGWLSTVLWIHRVCDSDLYRTLTICGFFQSFEFCRYSCKETANFFFWMVLDDPVEITRLSVLSTVWFVDSHSPSIWIRIMPWNNSFFFLFFVWVVFDDYPVNIGFSDSDSPANFRGIHGREQRWLFLG